MATILAMMIMFGLGTVLGTTIGFYNDCNKPYNINYNRSYLVTLTFCWITLTAGLIWLLFFVGSDWQFTKTQRVTVDIRKDSAIIEFNGEEVNLNAISGKNYKDGEVLLVKKRLGGPYAGIQCDEEFIIEEAK